MSCGGKKQSEFRSVDLCKRTFQQIENLHYRNKRNYFGTQQSFHGYRSNNWCKGETGRASDTVGSLAALLTTKTKKV